MNTATGNKLNEIAARIREMREVCGMTVAEMAQLTDVSTDEYVSYETGAADFPFTFLHKCAIAFNLEIANLLEGTTPKLTSYTVTRNGGGLETINESGILMKNLAAQFKNKIAVPYMTRYEYQPELQNKPIHVTTHGGQEFDYILSGCLKIQIGAHTEILHAGDSIFFDSSTPHGMIAVDGEDCNFIAFVIPGEKSEEKKALDTIIQSAKKDSLVCEKYIHTTENKKGTCTAISFSNTESFNFGFDILDELARVKPDHLALLHLDENKTERRFTFSDLRRASNQTANYFRSLGIKKGDKVMLVLKRHYQFWFCMMALNKLGAVAIPATNMLQEHDFEYRFMAANIDALVCTADGDTAEHAERAAAKCECVKNLILVGASREGWHDFDNEYSLYTGKFDRPEDAACGEDLMLMFFTSGTSGNPKLTMHNFMYPLGHFITAKYWHNVNPNGLHLTIADSGWAKCLWGKLYGQWLCEAPVFVYDFNRFDAHDILPLFAKYKITTFCSPATMYRMLIKEDMTKYDFSSVQHASMAGEALNPEVFRQFERETGLSIMEGFGQSESTLIIGNQVGESHKIGSMGKPVPLYDVDIVDADGVSCPVGVAGNIVIRTPKLGYPCGLTMGYYEDADKTNEVYHDGMYFTGDVAWRDEDGFYWYVGRSDDVIKSSGYRIGPFEIESVIMELPYVLECGVCAAPDEVRGQIVKACIVLTKGTQASEELKKEIQNYVKTHTAPYKYPRIVEFRESLPKTTSGKIQRNKL